MQSDSRNRTVRRQVTERLVEARRKLRKQEQRLAQLNYEWSIAKRLRNQAPTEEQREKWRVQSDAYLGMVLQQEEIIKEIREAIIRHQSRLAEPSSRSTDRAKP